jgi:hypothetical protein
MAPVLCFVTLGDSTMRKLIKIVLVTVTFLVFFYSTTVAMSIMYEVDSALLRFWGERNKTPEGPLAVFGCDALSSGISVRIFWLISQYRECWQLKAKRAGRLWQISAKRSILTTAPAGAQTEIIDRGLILAEMNGEFVKTADYYFHARELNIARCHAQDFPPLRLTPWWVADCDVKSQL